MVVSAEIEQQATKVAFMIPSYFLINSNHLLERETLEKVLEKVIVVEEIASAIAHYKKDFLEDTKVGIRQEIISIDVQDVFTLHLMTNQGSIYKKVKMSTPVEYGKVLLKFVNSKDKSYEGKSIQAGIITVTLEVLQRVVLDFYTSWKIKEAIKKTLASISQEKIKQTIESIAPHQGDSNEVALKIYKLLRDYELIGAYGKVVDNVFIRSIKEILAQSGMYTALSIAITTIVHTFFTNFLHVTVGGIFPWLIPVAIGVLAYQAFTFQETLANKVSADVADKVSLEFGKFNREISNNVKLQIIKNICSVM